MVAIFFYEVDKMEQQCLMIQNYLKLVSATFYEICIFSPNDNLSKTMKNVFYFILKAPFLLKIFNYCNFFPSFPRFPDSKGQMELE